jgi:hypothetical protein
LAPLPILLAVLAVPPDCRPWLLYLPPDIPPCECSFKTKLTKSYFLQEVSPDMLLLLYFPTVFFILSLPVWWYSHPFIQPFIHPTIHPSIHPSIHPYFHHSFQ